MSYLKEFGDNLRTKIAELPEATQNEVVRFAKEAVLTSYRNGQKAPVSKKEKSSK